MIRVVLADDQPLVRRGFAYFVDAEPDLTVVGEAGDGAEAVDLARDLRPDVVVMDIRMPGLDGIAATRSIITDESLTHTRVLVLTTFQLDHYVFAALRAGASGFLGKDAEPDDLIDAIRTVHGGESLLSAAALRALITRFLAEPEPETAPSPAAIASLTDREREVLVLVARGLSNDDIAARLVVSPHTVKTHVNRAMAKLDAHDRAQLVIAAYAAGLTPPPVPGSLAPD